MKKNKKVAQECGLDVRVEDYKINPLRIESQRLEKLYIENIFVSQKKSTFDCEFCSDTGMFLTEEERLCFCEKCNKKFELLH